MPAARGSGDETVEGFRVSAGDAIQFSAHPGLVRERRQPTSYRGFGKMDSRLVAATRLLRPPRLSRKQVAGLTST